LKKKLQGLRMLRTCLSYDNKKTTWDFDQLSNLILGFLIISNQKNWIWFFYIEHRFNILHFSKHHKKLWKVNRDKLPTQTLKKNKKLEGSNKKNLSDKKNKGWKETHDTIIIHWVNRKLLNVSVFFVIVIFNRDIVWKRCSVSR
jgi:hypothetical protein